MSNGDRASAQKRNREHRTRGDIRMGKHDHDAARAAPQQGGGRLHEIPQQSETGLPKAARRLQADVQRVTVRAQSLEVLADLGDRRTIGDMDDDRVASLDRPADEGAQVDLNAAVLGGGREQNKPPPRAPAHDAIRGVGAAHVIVCTAVTEHTGARNPPADRALDRFTLQRSMMLRRGAPTHRHAAFPRSRSRASPGVRSLRRASSAAGDCLSSGNGRACAPGRP